MKCSEGRKNMGEGNWMWCSERINPTRKMDEECKKAHIVRKETGIKMISKKTRAKIEEYERNRGDEETRKYKVATRYL